MGLSIVSKLRRKLTQRKAIIQWEGSLTVVLNLGCISGSN
jgi:hypothetical protein